MQPVLEPDVGLDDPPVIEDHRVGDDGVDGAARARRLGLPHAVADHLAAAELHLFAVGREILLDLDDEFAVGEPQPIAFRRPEHVGIGSAGEGGCHGVAHGTGEKAGKSTAATSNVAVEAQPSSALISARK